MHSSSQITLYLFRHGETLANEKRLYYGATDIPLSERGREALKEKLEKSEKSKALGKTESTYPDLSDSKIYTSGMKRAEETLSILYPEIANQEKVTDGENEIFPKIIRESGFREMNFGDFEMKDFETLSRCAEFLTWMKNESENFGQNPCPNGESGAEMNERVLASLKKMLENAITREDFSKTNEHSSVNRSVSIALFAHAGTISLIMRHFFPNEKKNFYEWTPDFGEGYKIVLYRHFERAERVEKSITDEKIDPFARYSVYQYEKIPFPSSRESGKAHSLD